MCHQLPPRKLPSGLDREIREAFLFWFGKNAQLEEGKEIEIKWRGRKYRLFITTDK